MAKITAITTGEQSVTAVGAVTGTMATTGLTGDYTIKLRVRGLAAAQKISIGLENSALGTFSTDILQDAVYHFVGADQVDGSVRETASYDIPCTVFGGATNKYRFNAYVVTGAPTALVEGWFEA